MTVLLYAGQGSQFIGMGKDLYEDYPAFRKIVDEAPFSFDHLKLMAEGPEEQLNDTRFTQPCMAAFAAGVTQVLKENGIVPDAACGLSLGEYGALYAAGVWGLKEYLKIVEFRGNAMADAAEGMQSAMYALIGITADQAEKACEEGSRAGVAAVVNYNCPGQYVVCGDEPGADETVKYAADNYRARAIKLKTSGPFHTRFLKPAGDALRECFSAISFSKPAIPVAINVTGKLYEENEDLKVLLERQVQSPVRFEDDLKALLALGADEFIEIGPGKTLSGLLTKTARAEGKKVKTTSISTSEDLRKLLG